MFRRRGWVISMVMRRSHDRLYSNGGQQSKRTRQQPPDTQPRNSEAAPFQHHPRSADGCDAPPRISFQVRSQRPSFRYYHDRYDSSRRAWDAQQVSNQSISYMQQRYVHSSEDDVGHPVTIKKNSGRSESQSDQSQSSVGNNWNRRDKINTEELPSHNLDTSTTIHDDRAYLPVNSADEQGKVTRTPQFVSAEKLGRKWISVPSSTTEKNSGFTFSVLSYNLLADSLLYDNLFLYRNCKDQGYMDWDYRKQNLLKEILSYNADILCLQEVQVEHFYNWFKVKLERKGYKSLYKQRSGNKRDGCAIFFKASKFKAILAHSIEFTKPHIPLMDRNNVAAILVLEPRTKSRSSLPICVATTHLLFNKKRGDIKLAQLAYLLAELDKYASFSQHKGRLSYRGMNSKDGSYMPIILCGDFNSLPFSPLYDLVVNGRLKYEGRSRVHISGQSNASANKAGVFGKWLLPPELNLSHSCKWKPREVITVSDGESEPFASTPSVNSTHDTSDCMWRDSTPPPFPVRGKCQSEKVSNPTGRDRSFNASVTSSAKYHQNCADSCPTELQQPKAQGFMNVNSGRSTEPINNVELQGKDRILSESGIPKNALSQGDGKEGTSDEEPGVLRHELNFKSVHSHMFPDGSREVTTCHTMSAYAVDYIFYTQSLEQRGLSSYSSSSVCRSNQQSLELTGYLSLLKEQQLDNLGLLPNRHLSSDHVALLASFNLR